MTRLRGSLWSAGGPARLLLITAVRIYRVALSGMLGGQCRFHPTCSEYAEQAIRSVGAMRGTILAAWRILRCSPLSAGGIDEPPRSGLLYDSAIQERSGGRR